MPLLKQSNIFVKNFVCWKIFGLWSGRNKNKYYKYYSITYLLITLILYNVLLTINLIYTPRTIEFLIREVIFYFTEIAVMSKVFMILIMRDKIIEAFNLLDSEEMEGDDEKSRQSIDRNFTRYQRFWKIYAIMSNLSYSSQVFIPVFIYLILKSNLDLPICKYYFLSDETRNKYFVLWFFYQSWGMYGHMMYNVSIDSFIAGLLMVAITQCRVLEEQFFDIEITSSEKKLLTEFQEKNQMARLKKCLRRYDYFLNYCKVVQKVIDLTMFVQFGVSSAIICVVMSGLLLPASTETYIFLVSYLFAMMTQIFLPGYLGTQLSYESQKLAFAAYNAEWIPRSESFKRSIRIFIERANVPIQMSGLNMFPLSLTTFVSIMKSAYSFFTLIRNFQTE